MNIILLTHFHKIDLSHVDTISFQPLKSLIILDYRNEDVTIHFDNKAECFRFMKMILKRVHEARCENEELIQIDTRDIWALFECYETSNLMNGIDHLENTDKR